MKKNLRVLFLFFAPEVKNPNLTSKTVNTQYVNSYSEHTLVRKKNISCIKSVNSECFDARSFAEFLSEFYLYCLKFHGNQFNGQLACFVRHAQLYQNQISNRLREQPSNMVSRIYQVDYICLLLTIRLRVEAH